jgi:eukaryotic-like serine/threonine-protein kinase
MTLQAGSLLGPYAVVERLGVGGMGEVYRARDPRLGRDVAIKVLPSAFSADADRLRRFEQEARAASALNHPNILTIHDIGTHNGVSYVVSELLEGETLRERMGGARLSVRRAIDYGILVARGLAAAHERGIVHRDLKPENLFVTKDERVKILDFGLAKLTQPENRSAGGTKVPTLVAETEPGIVMGTVGYMSPEQVRGEPVDHRSDIFSFGAVLYEMLSGHRAFGGRSAADTLSAILKEDPPELTQTNWEIPPSLDRVVRHCLEKSPQARIQAARDVAFALEEVSGASAAAPPRGAAPARPRSALRLAAIGALVVTLLVVLGINAGKIRERLSGAAPAGRLQSIAVLPLQNFSHDAEQEYFADGMTEELITNLAQIRSLRVISRTSVMGYKGTKKRVPEIGGELNVDTVLEGSVQRSGQRVRITAQLVRVSTDDHLWARSYERDLRDVLTLQGEVARAITSEIHVRLRPQEKALLERARAVNPAAHEAHLRGITEKNLKKSMEYFREAIRLDPTYAASYAGLARVYFYIGLFGGQSPREAFGQERDAAQKAIGLDERLAGAHSGLALVKVHYDWDWAGAEREYKRALELNPSEANVHHAYSHLLIAMSRGQESLAETRRAVELNPFDPALTACLAWHNLYAREYDQAVAQSQKVLKTEPDYWWAVLNLAWAYEQKGEYPEAIAEFERSLKIKPGSSLALAGLGHTYALAGKKREAASILAQLQEEATKRFVPAYDLATVYAGLGDTEQAFAWLEKACLERSAFLVYVRWDPKFDSLHSDPRFQNLLRRIGLPA